jgi:Zn-dependent protease with chaperone function
LGTFFGLVTKERGWGADMLRAGTDYPAMVGETMHIPLLFGLAWTVIALYFQAAIIRRMTGAHAIERRHEPKLYNLVENLSITAGIPVPKIEIIESPALNAYASGLSPNDAVVAVTRGLLQKLNERELTAVLAHEITHIKNYDIRLVVLSSVLHGLMARVADFAWTKITRHKVPLVDLFLTRPEEQATAETAAQQRGRFYAFVYIHMLLITPFVADGIYIGAAVPVVIIELISLICVFIHVMLCEWRGEKSFFLNDISYLPSMRMLMILPLLPLMVILWGLMVTAGFVTAMAYALSAVITGAISRSREFMADAGAVELTKDASALISALRRIAGRDHLADVNPMVLGMMISSSRGGWMATHPSIDERIEALVRFGGGQVAAKPAQRPVFEQRPVARGVAQPAPAPRPSEPVVAAAVGVPVNRLQMAARTRGGIKTGNAPA